MSTEAPYLSDIHTHFGENPEGVFQKHTQDLPQSYLDDLRRTKDDSGAPAGDFHQIASIPMIVVEKWAREGFDIMKHSYSAKEIINRLRRENLDGFITSKKV